MQTLRFLMTTLLAGVALACGGGGDDGVAEDRAGLLPPPGPPNGAAGASSELGQPGGRPPTPEPTPEPLPDLVLDAAYLVDTVALDSVDIADACLLAEGCVTGLGERRVLRFGSRTGNVGTADFVLGTPDADNPLWTDNTCQMTFDLVGFARYELIDRATGNRVLTGAKSGFCIADAEQWLPESGASCEVYDCDRQGISRGCADNYGSSLECQWVDITDVPPGAYELRVTINADRDIPELDYENNLVTVPVQLTVDAVTVTRVER
jgi:hypothetical protein